ncbi:hypothetical protein [Roseibium sp. M-1]
MSPSHDNRKTDNDARRFLVTVEKDKLESFKRVVSRRSDAEMASALSVPLTFPAAWYGLREMRDWIMEAAGLADNPVRSALLHLEQTIEMSSTLEAGGTYNLDVRVEKLRDGKALKMSAQVSNMQEVSLAVMTSLFAVVSSRDQQQ